jgi:hypothetical protein
VTGAAVAMKAVMVAPLATVAATGTDTVALLLAIVNVAPAAGAAFVSVTEQLVAEPLSTVAGLQLTAETCNCVVTVMDADWEAPLYEAVMDAVWSVVTFAAVAVKVLVAAPEETVTAVGIASAELFVASDMAAPPLGADFVRVTVQIALPPPTSVVGVQLSVATWTCVVTSNDADCEEPLYAARNVTG